MTEPAQQIVDFILKEIIRRPGTTIAENTPLVSSGLIDSLALVDILAKLELRETVLVVAPAFEQNIRLATRNLQKVELITSNELNTYHTLRSSKLLFTRDGFARVEERLKD